MSECFKRLTKIIDLGLKELSEQNMAILEKATACDMEMLQAFQTWQSKAHAEQILKLEEAQFIYDTIGNSCSPERWLEQQLSTRVAIMEFMKILAEKLGIKCQNPPMSST